MKHLALCHYSYKDVAMCWSATQAFNQKVGQNNNCWFLATRIAIFIIKYIIQKCYGLPYQWI